MKTRKRILLLAMALVMLFSVCAFATENQLNGGRFSPSVPTLTVSGTTATCRATVRSSGATIVADLELWQGGVLIASWHQTGSSRVTFNETATIVHGMTYTLTLSGTVNGIEFVPQSVTKTL